ncbi:MAG: hypothetical protein COY69_02815 [Candidatus Magasanikbacteria bacterium CG_4_10_14_0_8_um_filter_32_14]|uniref:Type II toxin-antitoxin system HicB family antitoxin n=1 Tax=Candidatus Magasanikbacteria bacterium CG_4_10_14_0_8_um_filter_32_14 TaxID=1974640 RepID=A0A2M7R9P7_9BACT|nr:MAG: hypothetical protein COY69_02815 [Candidatus Magasanikbacteria bacterium CG_4_10_14_0_8_um_filter_32_14]
MSLKLTTTYHQEGKFFVAFCPELGVTSQGKSLEMAEKNLKEAIGLYLEDASPRELKRYRKQPFIKVLDFDLA